MHIGNTYTYHRSTRKSAVILFLSFAFYWHAVLSGLNAIAIFLITGYIDINVSDAPERANATKTILLLS